MGITIFKIFHLKKYILGYMFRNQVFGVHVAIILNLRPYIRRYTYPNENFEYIHPPIYQAFKA